MWLRRTRDLNVAASRNFFYLLRLLEALVPLFKVVTGVEER